MAKTYLGKLWNALWGIKEEAIIPEVVENRLTPQKKQVSDLPNTRQSAPDFLGFNNAIALLGSKYNIVSPDFNFEIIPLIRRLTKGNADLSQALKNIRDLANTGHRICFDPAVSPEQVDQMRSFLTNRQTDWAPGQPNMHGLINKMFSQIMISGCLSVEWVPNKDLTDIQTVILVSPEDIRFSISADRTTYLPYQQVRFGLVRPKGANLDSPFNLLPLNPNTYKYYALNGDTELPYGTPPFLPAIDRLLTQASMLTNIDNISTLIGLLGFLSTVMDKPEKENGESDIQYEARLNLILEKAKVALMGGMKDGVVVGYKGDYEFDFNSLSGRDVEGLITLFKNNELQIFSAVDFDPILAGRDYNTSETQITVIFIKLISQLTNMQNIVGSCLEFGYSLALRLAGFNFKYLSVEFDKSTVQDKLKNAQAEEIEIRNAMWKYVLGIINQDKMADELGYENPAEAEPLVDPELLIGAKPADPASDTGGTSTDKRQGQKNKSAKKTRDNKKPVQKQYK